uniref:Putative secreted peptide n=1 Tax=Anopheles braziliensis TaxID=58242 RepID=A0A2M3ZNU3_9DIPT
MCVKWFALAARALLLKANASLQIVSPQHRWPLDDKSSANLRHQPPPHRTICVQASREPRERVEVNLSKSKRYVPQPYRLNHHWVSAISVAKVVSPFHVARITILTSPENSDGR